MWMLGMVSTYWLICSVACMMHAHEPMQPPVLARGTPSNVLHYWCNADGRVRGGCTYLQALAKVVGPELLQRQGVQGLGAVGGGAGVQLHATGVVRMLVHSRVVGQGAQGVGLAQSRVGAGLQA